MKSTWTFGSFNVGQQTAEEVVFLVDVNESRKASGTVHLVDGSCGTYNRNERCALIDVV